MRRVIALAVGLALALTSMALAVTSGTYTGTTSQKLGGVHYPISFRVSGSKITGGVYKANYHGHAGCSAASDGTNRWARASRAGARSRSRTASSTRTTGSTRVTT